MSFTKPEVHKRILLSSEEDVATTAGKRGQNFIKLAWAAVFLISLPADRQTDRQTETLISQYFFGGSVGIVLQFFLLLSKTLLVSDGDMPTVWCGASPRFT